MKNRLIAVSAFSLAFLLTGCATRTDMAFKDDSEKAAQATKPIFLMTATLKNVYKTSFQPQMIVLHVEKDGAKEQADRLNFLMDDKAREETDTVESGNTYFLRMPLDPGRYEIVGATSKARTFPITGFYFTPLHSTLEARERGIYYLGHVNATLRERKDNEFKAGPVVPLLDQAVSGASSGTFDVEITDELAKDEPLFRSRFPALKDAVIQKAILPSFDRAKAQEWWEAH
jgi:hypothetical protein